MRRILITGMSGTGKSTVTAELRHRGFHAIDLDNGFTELRADGRRAWRLDAVNALLDESEHPAGVGATAVFLAGCEENMSEVLERFDAIVLLHAPRPVIEHRLAARTNNDFGKAPGELEQVLRDLDETEPLLRRVATAEVATDAPVDTVVDLVIAAAFATRTG